MHRILPRKCLQRHILGRAPILAHSGLYLTKRLTLKWLQVGAQPAQAAHRPMAEIHGLGSWPAATTPSADKFLLPRHGCPTTPSTCSSCSHMTLGAGRGSRATRPHMGHGPGPGSHAHAETQPTEVLCLQCSLQSWAKPHLSHRESIICTISFVSASCSSFLPKGCSTFLLHLGEAELFLPFWSI